MKGALALSRRREALCANPPRCVRCSDVQVQLLSAEDREWRCRKCGWIFNTEGDE